MKSENRFSDGLENVRVIFKSHCCVYDQQYAFL
jgi:hypothetical protein